LRFTNSCPEEPRPVVLADYSTDLRSDVVVEADGGSNNVELNYVNLYKAYFLLLYPPDFFVFVGGVLSFVVSSFFLTDFVEEEDDPLIELFPVKEPNPDFLPI
jgi:hypothetical protein